MKIGIFCSANDNINSEYFRLAEELGKWMGEQGLTLVYGGTDSGLMRTIGHAVHDNGGTCIGAVPRIIEQGGRQATCLDVDIPCENLSDRKEIMLMHSDVLVALPGGIGTLDEVFTVSAAKTIGYHQKQVILYNMNGFWDSLIALMDDLQTKGMIRGEYHTMITSVNSIQELKEVLSNLPSQPHND